MEKKRTRIIDIAEELGVSTATVSNVIHGKTKKISDETVRRVQELLEQRQYIPMVKVTDQWNEILRFASMWNMEGLVLIGFCEQDYKRLRESIHIPFVVYDGYFQGGDRLCNLTILSAEGRRQLLKRCWNVWEKKILS